MDIRQHNRIYYLCDVTCKSDIPCLTFSLRGVKINLKDGVFYAVI